MKAGMIRVRDEQPHRLFARLAQECAIGRGRGTADNKVPGRIEKMRYAGAVEDGLGMLHHMLFAKRCSRTGQ
jgi:hypothetical protein